MAIYHFSAQIISRSQGRSSVAAAAYRSAEKLTDERTGLVHDFTRKSDVVRSDILLPKGAPERFSDRSELWNEVEKSEKRKDAQVAREITISLPLELSAEQNWELLTTFVQGEFVDRGMIADVNFHRGHKGGEDQPHGHIMLTTREVGPDGFGQKVRAWNDRALLNSWRERWAEHCNLGLAKHGHDIRIDHRTLEAQGIDLEPQSKMGPKEAGSRMARFAEHQGVAQRNGERILADPGIALKALTQQQSTFGHRDIARLAHRHSVDKEQFDQVFAAIKAYPELVQVGVDDRGKERFSSRELVEMESKLMDQALERSQQQRFGVSDQPAQVALQGKGLSGEQRLAFDHVVHGPDLACVVGYAGTGKSYMLGAAREAWEAEGFRVQGMTLSGIAAENLEGSSGIASKTVASHLWHWDRGKDRLRSKDVVVVDEAGMLGSRQMSRIMKEVDRARAKLVLVGDPEQLQAIEAGAAYRGILERVGFVEMTEIRRQKEPWQQRATRDFASQRTKAGLLAYQEHDNVHVFSTQDQAISEMVARWDEVRSQSQSPSQIMLAYTRDEVRALNEQARSMRQAQKELGPDYAMETSRGIRNLAEQDRIYFLRNENQSLGVKNGTLGTIESIEGDRLTVSLDREDQESSREISFRLKDYNDIDHGYAATVYKAQGTTVDRAHVLASPYFDRHSTYVAMSRHREGVDLYYSEETFPSFEKLTETLSREREKDMTIDYGLDKEEFIKPQDMPQQEMMPDTTEVSPLSMQEQIASELGRRVEDTYSFSFGSHAYQELSSMSSNNDGLAAFKARFEQENPEKAEALARSILPEQERLDLEKGREDSLAQSGVESKDDVAREDFKDRGLQSQENTVDSSISDKKEPKPDKNMDNGWEMDF